MRVSAAGNMPLQGLVKPPAKPVVMIVEGVTFGLLWDAVPHPARNLRFLDFPPPLRGMPRSIVKGAGNSVPCRGLRQRPNVFL